jgi:putative phosphoribosyl transferase
VRVAIFADRGAAGRELATALDRWRGTEAVVYGIPRGGVIVAAEVCRALGLPLAAVAVRKVGASGREEFAVGAIATGVRVVDDAAMNATGTTPEQFATTEERERIELARRRAMFASAPPTPDRPAIVVDDGVATGATALAACRSLRRAGVATIILAVPVAPEAWRPEPDCVDEYVCPHLASPFWAVGAFYDDFAQTPDFEVMRLLDAAAED